MFLLLVFLFHLALCTIQSDDTYVARLLLEFHHLPGGEQHQEHRVPPLPPQIVYGNFTRTALVYPFNGDAVLITAYRACERASRGLDATLMGMVAIALLDQMQTYMSGCVSPHNQMRFAADSGASAVIVGPWPTNKPFTRRNEDIQVPVVLLAAPEAGKLRALLSMAQRNNLITRVQLSPIVHDVTFYQSMTIDSIPKPLSIDGAILFSILCLLSIIVLAFLVRDRYRRYMQSFNGAQVEAIDPKLIRKALESLQCRRYDCTPMDGSSTQMVKASLSKAHCYESKLSVLSTTATVLERVSSTFYSGEQCAICLEEYNMGDELRTLRCGHEFHRKCVDRWLMNKANCPLCQDPMLKENNICADQVIIESI